MSIRRVLVATDFSDRARAALVYAVELARSLDAEIDLLHVVAPPPPVELVIDATLDRQRPLVDDDVIRDADRKLGRMLATIAHEGITIRKMIEPGDAAATTVRMAVELPADLIVIGTRARTGLAALALGSVAHRVMTCAPCPVLTLRGNEPPPQRGG